MINIKPLSDEEIEEWAKCFSVPTKDFYNQQRILRLLATIKARDESLQSLERIIEANDKLIIQPGKVTKPAIIYETNNPFTSAIVFLC